MIRKILSSVFIFLGFILILVSVLLLAQNDNIETEAEISTNNVLVEIFDELGKNNKNQNNPNYNSNKEEMLVDGNLYSFVLNIPSLNLTLPIQSSWSYPKLKVSPCIYKTEPLSIAAHNYNAHFGKLSTLKLGQTATIEYFSGDTQEYKIISVEKIHETNIEHLNNKDYDLTLFTCNYANNNERIVVRLNKI